MVCGQKQTSESSSKLKRRGPTALDSWFLSQPCASAYVGQYQTESNTSLNKGVPRTRSGRIGIAQTHVPRGKQDKKHGTVESVTYHRQG